MQMLIWSVRLDNVSMGLQVKMEADMTRAVARVFIAIAGTKFAHVHTVLVCDHQKVWLV
jgi:hypothetical protein